jgi:hypothetical protein
MLLFYLDDSWVLKEINLESYNFQTCMKWAVVNSLALASFEDPLVKARKFSKPILKSCKFVLKIKLYRFLKYKPILHFYWLYVTIGFRL